MKIRTYSELRKLKTFEERYYYLRLNGVVGQRTFGYDRYINQVLYHSPLWQEVRDKVIVRDNACDLGMEGYEITGSIIVHHMNPITKEDIESGSDIVFSPEFLICTVDLTHKAIHYGDESLLPKLPVERRKNDTCPWLR